MTATTARCSASAGTCCAPATRPRTRCSRRSCAPIARWSPTGRRRTRGRGSTRSPATTAGRCSPAVAMTFRSTPPRPAADGPGEQVQLRADLRAVVADVERLPDDQRAALVLAELADLSHEQIARGDRRAGGQGEGADLPGALDADRGARGARDAVRADPRAARDRAGRRAAARRRCVATCGGCEPCRAYRTAVAEQRRALALALPVTPSLGLKAAVLGSASAAGGAGAAAVGGASTAASLAGGFAAKVVAGALLVGGGAGGGAAIVHRRGSGPSAGPRDREGGGRRAAPPPPRPRGVARLRRARRAGRRRTRSAGGAERRAPSSALHGPRSRGHEPRRAAGPVARRVARGQAGKPAKAAVPRRAPRPARVKGPKQSSPSPSGRRSGSRPSSRSRSPSPERPANPAKPVKPAER